MSAADGPAGRRPAAGTGKGERKRAELLDAAEGVLLTSGHAELSMRAVATAAGVRLGHLQYYFPARSDLVSAVLARILDNSLERLSPLLGATAPDPAGIVRALLADQDDPQLVRLFTEVWALAAVDDTVAPAVRGFYGDYLDRLTGHLRLHCPELSAPAARARAAVFVMLIEGAALFRSGVAAHRTPETDAELIGTAVRLLTAPADGPRQPPGCP
ncbi:TetR/AcrR family transcriptional regulator [Streptomyces sp. CAU 1734]|uniref:TetR/AcrR family transcriptional regulator n=1 Tax=Streptomyces sp. CAU 1734 TaxID=3140360 RepID=UPI0032605D5E